MAIILEHEKKQVSWIAVLTVFLALAVIFAGAYFLFFKRPEIIDIAIPKKFDDLNMISRISFNPDDVIQSPAFRSLRQYEIVITQTQAPGKANPFQP